jgi:hypothetical protein
MIVNFSASSAVLSVKYFDTKYRIWIFVVAGLAPVLSIVLVGLRVFNAHPFHVFEDPMWATILMWIINISIMVLGRFGMKFPFFGFVVLMLVWIFLIRFFLGDRFFRAGRREHASSAMHNGLMMTV